MQYGLVLLAAVTLAGCGEPAVNSGAQVEVYFINSTDLSVDITVLSDGTSVTFSSVTPSPTPMAASTSVRTAGEPVQFHVVAGKEIAAHTCHVHADAIGNEDNVPTAVIYGEPLRVVCQSGWQEEEAE